jgi:signal transduction histidine kinase
VKLDLGRLQGGESLMSRLSFRSKLLLVLFVPFLALVVVAAAGLSDRFTSLHAQQQYGDLSAPLRSLDQASRAVQNESVVSSWFVASGGAPKAELDKARAATDVAVKQFKNSEQAFVDSGLSATALAALDATNQGLDQLPAERTKVDARSVSAADTRNFYLGVDEHMLDFGERVSRDLASADVSASLTRVFTLERAQHEHAREASVYIAVLASGQVQDFSEWVGAQAAQQQYLATFRNTATSDELAAFDNASGAPKPDATLPASFPAAGETPAEYYVDYQRETKTIDGAIDAVQRVINQTASNAASAATREVRIYGGAAVFAMFLTLLLIWFVSRAVIGPVRRLTAAAREMSQRQLPALVESLRTGGDLEAIRPVRIEVQSEDEIGDLAQAFNDVEAVTFEVAQEQSRLLKKGMGDLFVNLARRNQSLVQRQLELLDDLERNEHDPAALDALFKLDHMATRMRRNAESLLVLSGAEQPRQWQQPIALIDVVRAAAAEIADFPRVELVGIDDGLAVSGRAVSDVAHLLAELLENATSFSPPDSAVVVSGAVSAAGFVLAVSDQGIGMTPERIAESNKLLADPPAVGLALSRALGLHVVGSLAARHGISVELRPGAPGGLVALVALPTAVLEPRPVAAPAAPAPGNPVYKPDLDDRGEAAPLGARRMVSRPPDEPPVEEWGRQDLGAAAPPAPPTPPAPPAPAPVDELHLTSAPFEAPAYESPVYDAPVYEAPAPEPPPFQPTTIDANSFETTTESPTSASAAYDAPAYDAPSYDAQAYDAPAYDAPPSGPSFGGPTYDAPAYDAPTFDAAPPADEPTGATYDDSAPLPTRVPGQNLSHHPRVANEPVDTDVDPMRAYRVHELLTRHAQGKRRGQMGEQAPDGAPTPSAPGGEEDAR